MDTPKLILQSASASPKVSRDTSFTLALPIFFAPCFRKSLAHKRNLTHSGFGLVNTTQLCVYISLSIDRERYRHTDKLPPLPMYQSVTKTRYQTAEIRHFTIPNPYQTRTKTRLVTYQNSYQNSYQSRYQSFGTRVARLPKPYQNRTKTTRILAFAHIILHPQTGLETGTFFGVELVYTAFVQRSRTGANLKGNQMNKQSSAGISSDDAWNLRRISMTLQRWHELECGDGNGCIERDEKTGRPYWYNANSRRAYSLIPDREKGALKRLAAIMAKYPDLRAYVQGDPRGAALYILQPGDVPEGEDPSCYYSRGLAVYK